MNKFRTVRWRLASAFFLVILFLLAGTGAYLLDWTERYYVRATSDDLRRESKAICGLVEANPTDVSSLVNRLGRDLGHRVTIIRSDGTVLADSERNSRNMPNHSNRPEFRQALASGCGVSTRYSVTLRTRMLYVAVCYGHTKQPDGVVRVAEPLSGLDVLLRRIQATFLLAGLVAILAAAYLSLRLASSITRPIESIADAAGRLERGELAARVPGPHKSAGELGSLAYAFNSMAERLQSNLDEISRQKAQMQAIFDHSVNGLLLIDSQGKIRVINPAACHILGVDHPEIVLKTLIEGTLNHDLASLVERVRRTQEPAALDMELTIKERRSVHAYVAPLSLPEEGVPVLVVLHDVTSIRALDAVRRDFVANVSHELRTPLASIKAMAETILLRHASNPAVAPDFAQSIVQEADRMTLLAEDLLDLTRIEAEGASVPVGPIALREIIEDVLSRFAGAAEKKRLTLLCDVPDEEIAEANASALEQILSNLIDNAVKYTPEGGVVRIGVEHQPDRIALSVSDDGIGIPAHDLPRIFERFYRVDKARSRESGGTGLGLAIVKHLCEQMGASVSVRSEVGVGSTFIVSLPAPRK